MIEKLTQKQIDSIPSWVDKGIKMGFAKGDGTVDREKVMELTDNHRVLCGLPKARDIVFAVSPHQVYRKLKHLGVTTNNAFYGNQDAHSLNEFAFWRYEIGLRDETDKIKYLHELGHHISWMWISTLTTIVCPLPVELHTTTGKIHAKDYHRDDYLLTIPIPHNYDGKALAWADGEGFYAIHGTRIPEKYSWIVTTPRENLDPEKILAIKNEDIKAAAIKKIGVENMFDRMDKTLVHEKTFPIGGHYALWDIQFIGEETPRRYLQMNCPSKGDLHIEATNPKWDTVDKALADRVRFDENGNPLNLDAIFNATEFEYLEPEVHT